AIAWSRDLGRPLLVLEALRAGYPFASDRLHAFVLAGMRANAAAFARAGVTYHPFVEPEPGAGRGLLRALATDAAVVVADDSPAFFLPRMLAGAARMSPVRFEAVDSNGLIPLAATPRVFPTAFAFRRFVQGAAREFLAAFPEAAPLRKLALPGPAAIPPAILARWPAAPEGLLAAAPAALAGLPIDHSVAPVAIEGGEPAARRALDRFIGTRLDRYSEERNDPDAEATSGFSPYLHFGHLSAHEVFRRVAGPDFDPARLPRRADGKRTGFWGLPPAAEEFLDQLVTWREIGFHTAAKLPGYDRYESLPGWARETLEAHAGDRREHPYPPEALRDTRTHDPIWNAAQTELRTEGRLHNYLRMLWGKKILEWTESPREALRVMLELNDRYALDGRDPNSVSGIFWCLGRYDRAWGPERPIFGKIRYMSSANTARKVRLRTYLARHRPEHLR
ncbi:MAG: deoxyribodipyrimidine photolyase, partial [Planctomycetes bacterium]|nr:deoxyribodipyrimidine photolyase [Planctomycetota bacterium]